MDKISLLHISDLHIALEPNYPEIKLDLAGAKRFFTHESCASYNPAVLRQLSRFIKKNRENLDALIITGDIATTGFPYDLRIALKKVKEMESIIPLFLLPGNHDRYRYVSDRIGLFLTQGSRNFHDIFANYWDSDVRVNPLLKNGNLTVCVISADFSLRKTRHSPFGGFYAQGEVYTDILENLIKQTQKVANKNKSDENLAIIWAVHFPPFAHSIPNHSKLKKSRKLIEAAENNNVLAVISGHLHYKIKEAKNNVFYLGAGTATQVTGSESSNHFQVLNIVNASGKISIDDEDYIFNENSFNEHEFNEHHGKFIKYGLKL